MHNIVQVSSRCFPSPMKVMSNVNLESTLCFDKSRQNILICLNLHSCTTDKVSDTKNIICFLSFCMTFKTIQVFVLLLNWPAKIQIEVFSSDQIEALSVFRLFITRIFTWNNIKNNTLVNKNCRFYCLASLTSKS